MAKSGRDATMSVAALRRLMARPTCDHYHGSRSMVWVKFCVAADTAKRAQDRGAPEEDLTDLQRFAIANFRGLEG